MEDGLMQDLAQGVIIMVIPQALEVEDLQDLAILCLLKT